MSSRAQERSARASAAYRRPSSSSIRLLQRGDLGELDGAQHEVGRVQSAEAVADTFVERPVIVGRGLPRVPPMRPMRCISPPGPSPAPVRGRPGFVVARARRDHRPDHCVLVYAEVDDHGPVVDSKAASIVESTSSACRAQTEQPNASASLAKSGTGET